MPSIGSRGSAFGHCRDGHIAGPHCNHSCSAALSYRGISRGLGAEFSGARKGVGPHFLARISRQRPDAKAMRFFFTRQDITYHKAAAGWALLYRLRPSRRMSIDFLQPSCRPPIAVSIEEATMAEQHVHEIDAAIKESHIVTAARSFCRLLKTAQTQDQSRI
jgi:hypothetical protein